MKWILLILTILHLKAFSQGQGIVDASGSLARNAGALGAVANRQAADELFKQAIANEAEAWKTTPPNISLLAKAMVQAQDGIKADDQAKHNAQVALKALGTGNTSGKVDMQAYGLDEAKLQELATQSSPYLAQVESTAAGYGVKLTDDRQGVKTPFGFVVPLSVEIGTLADKVGKVATMLGFNAADIGVGIQAAVASREALNQALFASLPTTASLAEGASGAALKTANIEEKSTEGASGATFPGQGLEPAVLPRSEAEGVISQSEMSFMKFRDETLKRVGGPEETRLGGKDEHLFRNVHMRYQLKRQVNTFDETDGAQYLAGGL